MWKTRTNVTNKISKVFEGYKSDNRFSNMYSEVDDTILIPDGEFKTHIEITDKIDDIDEKKADILTLTNEISIIENLIKGLRRNLIDLRVNQIILDGTFVNLSKKMERMNTFLTYTYNDEPYTQNLDIFVLNDILDRKTEINKEIVNLKKSILENLVDRVDIENITNTEGVMKQLNDIKKAYDEVYKKIVDASSIVDVCSGLEQGSYPDYINNS
jgi:hypothetical protein